MFSNLHTIFLVIRWPDYRQHENRQSKAISCFHGQQGFFNNRITWLSCREHRWTRLKGKWSKYQVKLRWGNYEPWGKRGGEQEKGSANTQSGNCPARAEKASLSVCSELFPLTGTFPAFSFCPPYLQHLTKLSAFLPAAEIPVRVCQ